MAHHKEILNIQGLVFDMDGVIVDTEPIHTKAFIEFFNRYDMPYSENLLKSFIGFSVEENVKQILESQDGVYKFTLSEGVAERNAIYLGMLKNNHLVPKPGVDDLIGHCLDLGISLGLATSSPLEQVDAILDSLNGSYTGRYFEIFNTIVNGQEVKHKKPAPDIYHLAVKRLKILPQETIAIEDSPAGVKSANRAGLITIGWVNQYYSRNDLLEADRTIEDLRQVIQMIRVC